MGDEAAQERHNLEVSYPVANGVVKDWDDMHHIWHHTFYERLGIDPRECKILLTVRRCRLTSG